MWNVVVLECETFDIRFDGIRNDYFCRGPFGLVVMDPTFFGKVLAAFPGKRKSNGIVVENAVGIEFKRLN